MNTSKLAALALGAACALPVMAQTSASTAATPATPSTQSAAPDTRTMGAGPSVESGRTESRGESDRDLGWLGLLGLAGLLGLRRKHDDHRTTHDPRATGNVR